MKDLIKVLGRIAKRWSKTQKMQKRYPQHYKLYKRTINKADMEVATLYRAIEILKRIDEGKMFNIIKNSHFIDTKGDCYHTRKEKEDWLEKDCFGSLANCLYNYLQGNK